VARVRNPHTIGRVFDGAFDTYRANFKTIALASACVLFPPALLMGLTQVFYARGLLALVPSLMQGELMLEELGRLQIWSIVSNAVSVPFYLARLYLAAAVFASAPAMLAGKRPGVREFVRGGWSRFGFLVMVSLLVYTLTGIGVILLIVPGIYVWARLVAAPVIVVTEQAPLDVALSRSWLLTAGQVWRTLGFAVLLWIFTVVLETAVDSPVLIRQIVASLNQSDALFAELSAGWKTLEGTFSALAAALVYPFVELAWFHYYLDLRTRREGMDLVAEATRLAGERA
jgi:hypothetical protein